MAVCGALWGCNGSTASGGFTLDSASLLFANQNVNSASATKTVTVTNASQASLTLSTIGVTGDFTETNTCGSALAAGATCGVSVTFTPTYAGTRSGTLSATDSLGLTRTATLTGIAVAPAPVFSSTPPSSAEEGQMYSYTAAATDPDNGAVSFALSGGTDGTALNLSTLNWTPTHAESRVADSFTITATTSEGGTATQTFSVTPTGNINVTVNTVYYTRNGNQTAAFDLSAVPVCLEVPDGSGGFTTLSTGTGLGNPDGTFTIPNVPAGGFWVAIGTSHFWTSQSDLGFSGNAIGRPDSARGTGTLNVSLNVNDVPQNSDEFEVYSPDAPGDSFFSEPSGSSPWTQAVNEFYLLDASQSDELFVNHLLQSSLAGGSDYTIAESYDTSSVTLPNSGSANVSGSMVAAPTSSAVEVNVAGSQFAAYPIPALASAVRSHAATALNNSPVTSGFSIFAQPYNAPAITARTFSPQGAFGRDTGWPTLVSYAPSSPMTSDTDSGSIPYSNPFPATYSPVLDFNFSSAGAALPLPPPPPPPACTTTPCPVLTTTYTQTNSTSGPMGMAGFVQNQTLQFAFPPPAQVGFSVYMTPPLTSNDPAIAPVIGTVSNIAVNGTAFSSGAATSGLSPVISWTAPAAGTADQYVLNLVPITMTQETISVGNLVLGYNTNYNFGCCISYVTTSTSVSIPQVAAGSYAVIVEADSFHGGAANTTALPVGDSYALPGVLTVQ
ncbi:MAG: choice-of-anchor D domain-containing protein [Candidatus Acidiferrales bacterium]